MREEYEGGYSNDVVAANKFAMLHHVGVYSDDVYHLSHGECYALKRKLHVAARTTPMGVEVHKVKMLLIYNVVKARRCHNSIV